MKISTFPIIKGLVELRPFLRRSHLKGGCGRGNCRSCDRYYISLSDGKIGINAVLTKKEMEKFLAGEMEFISEKVPR